MGAQVFTHFKQRFQIHQRDHQTEAALIYLLAFVLLLSLKCTSEETQARKVQRVHQEAHVFLGRRRSSTLTVV